MTISHRFMRPCVPYFLLLILAGIVLGVAVGAFSTAADARDLDATAQPAGGVLVPALAGAFGGVLLSLLLYRWYSGAPGVRHRIKRAMRRGHIHMVYQPLANMSSGHTVGSRRWRVGPMKRWARLHPRHFLRGRKRRVWAAS